MSESIDRDLTLSVNGIAYPVSVATDRNLLSVLRGEIGLTGELLDTRARIKIAARQYEAAERDLLQALSQEKTPLRMFHLALTMQGQTPPRREEAAKTFQQAKANGLKEQSVHPADIAMYRTLMKAGD